MSTYGNCRIVADRPRWRDVDAAAPRHLPHMRRFLLCRSQRRNILDTIDGPGASTGHNNDVDVPTVASLRPAPKSDPQLPPPPLPPSPHLQLKNAARCCASSTMSAIVGDSTIHRDCANVLRPVPTFQRSNVASEGLSPRLTLVDAQSVVSTGSSACRLATCDMDDRRASLSERQRSRRLHRRVFCRHS